MKMTAKIIVSAKPSSFGFEDRVLLLDHPIKVGRSHKDDRPEVENAFFDCKVLSRNHATLSFSDGRFYLQDMGSSNGSFINNIRLSKSGEESKATELYSGDMIRFGSDVVDKAKNVTQKAVVARLKLFYPDGTECVLRPPESRLFRPMDSFDEAEGMNMSLMESMSREKILEERLNKVRGLISKHIGRSQSDMIRIFEDIKEELMNPFTERDLADPSKELEELERVQLEKMELGRRLSDIEKKLEDREQFCNRVQKKQQDDAVEIIKLRQLVDSQNADIADLETALNESQAKLYDIEESQTTQVQEKLAHHRELSDREVRETKLACDAKIKEMEDIFGEERNKIRQQLQEITSNEINLLNRIKSLESEKEYARAEVDKIVVKDADTFHYKQELEYRIECLTTELAHAREQVAELEGKTQVERDPEDIAMIEQQKQNLVALREEVSYIKKELIDARSRKAAAEDDLNTVKGTVETLTNSVNSLSNEGESLKKSIIILEEKLQEKTKEAGHLADLVTAMEAQPGRDEQSKVQVADLKQELANAQGEVKTRIDEIVAVRDLLRQEREKVQQNLIEISRLNGKVQEKEEEKEQLKSSVGDVDSLQAEINKLRNRLHLVAEELEVTREDNGTLSRELKQQQILYAELRKMRGMGEELEMLQQAQRDVVEARDKGDEAVARLREARAESGRLEAERMRLLREIAQLKSGRGGAVSSETGEGIDLPPAPKPDPTCTSPAASQQPVLAPTSALARPSQTVLTSEAMMAKVGNLRLYEILVGLLFLSVIISWNPYTLPL